MGVRKGNTKGTVDEEVKTHETEYWGMVGTTGEDRSNMTGKGGDRLDLVSKKYRQLQEKLCNVRFKFLSNKDNES